MNKAITDGVLLMPPAFASGLNVWSRGNGTPGSDTYASALNAAFVPADQDFGGCLELQKAEATQKLRYMGETPLLPGCYLRVSARIKAVSGNLPSVRIAAWAGGAGGVHVGGLTEVGPQVTLTTYGEVVEVSAIIGAGNRNGVHMVWGAAPLYGHFGLDLTGANGGIVRIDDIRIEDITGVFLRDIMAVVDVRDYGAIGNGVTNDQPAFEAADAAANGRTVLVPAGTFYLGDSVTMDNHVKFEGTVTMPADRVLALTKDFHLPAYIDAFGNEELAFAKAFQALLEDSDHESLDMGGRRINLSGPMDMQAAAPARSTFAQRRIVRNGQITAIGSSVWNDDVATSQATYSPGNALKLTNVTNIANIKVASLVTASGVGREVYVTSVNIAAQELVLSAPLYDAAGTQNYTFTRFKYMLDFSRFDHLAKFELQDLELRCSELCSGILLPPSGLAFRLGECTISRPKDRCLSSHGEGCQGMQIDNCQFQSNESGVLSQNRKSIVFNSNGNDIKVRNNQAVHFRHFAVIGGGNTILTGNHWYQGDAALNGLRTAGVVLMQQNSRATINSNYVDNSFIEWTNEQDPSPAYTGGLSFSGLSFTDNTCLSGNVAAWFGFLVVKPYGAGHFLNGVTVHGNIFRNVNGNIDRPERVDTSFADLDYSRFRNVNFNGNLYNQVNTAPQNPLLIEHNQTSESSAWVVDTQQRLPFRGWAVAVDAIVPQDKISTAANVAQYDLPYVQMQQGTNKDRFNLRWSKDVKGKVAVTVRCDRVL